MKHPRSLLRRAVGAVAAFVVASAALVNAGNSPARADQNTDIKFGPVTATDVIQDGLEVPDPATIKLVEVQAGPDGTGETERVVATDLVWGAPKFSSEDNRVAIGGDDTSATFTVVDQITLPVLLTNTATGRPAGSRLLLRRLRRPTRRTPRPPGRWSPQIPELTTPSIPPNLRRRRPSPSRHRPHRPPGPYRHPSSPDCPGPATTAASGRMRKVRGRVNPAPEPTRGGLPVPPLSRAGLFARDRPRAPKRCRRTRVVLCRDETVRLSRGLPKTVVKCYGQPCDVHRFREPLQALRR